MTATTCDLCSRPMGDQAYVCSGCTAKLREDLERVVLLAPEVEAAVARLARFGWSGGGSGARPLPVDLGAASDAASVGNTLSTWARHVAESRGVELPRPAPPAPLLGPRCANAGLCGHPSCAELRDQLRRMAEDPVRAARPVGIAVAAELLLANLEWLRHQREAAEAVDELEYAARLLERLLSGPVDRWYAGPCREPLADDEGTDTGELCEADLYAAPGAATVRCRSCGAEHDAATRREWLLDEAQDALVHAELMARALTAWGVGGDQGVTSARVRGMARHGRLLVKGTNAAGDPVYRVGDVVAVVEEQEASERARQLLRAAKDARRAERAAKTSVVDSATISPHDRSAVGEVSPDPGGPRLSCA